MKSYKLLGSTFLVASLLGMSACTGNFEEINTNPTGLAGSDLTPNMFFSEPQLSIYYNQSNGNWEYQLIQNLNADLYSGYFAIPSSFNSNNNNSLYYMVDGWNSFTLNYGMLHVLKPVKRILDATKAPDYEAIAKILRVAGMSKVTDVYGPIPYSKALQGGLFVEYDSQETIYTSFFQDLDDAADKLTSYINTNGDQPSRLSFDQMCGKSHTTWLKFCNTLRMRLAIRIAMVNPTLAKAEYQKSISNTYGPLTTSDPNIEVKDVSTRNPLAVISRDYNDCCISASFSSILNGYNDPRLAKMCLPVGWNGMKGDIYDKNGNATNSIGKFIGVRNGFEVPSTSDYKMYSIFKVKTDGTDCFSSEFPLPVMHNAESYFLRAEAVLRGWDSGNVQTYYEDGIRASMTSYGIASDKVEAYINGTTLPADYVDPHNPALNIAAMNLVPVKFDSSKGNEYKLQQIITQKWIANFPEGQEAWSEFRRTGYPVIFPIVTNRSNYPALTTLGIRRLPFCQDEKNNNAQGVETGYTMIGGQANDNISTRLWWDTGKNF